MKHAMKRRLAALVACLASMSMIVPSAASARETITIIMVSNNGGYPVMYRYVARY